MFRTWKALLPAVVALILFPVLSPGVAQAAPQTAKLQDLKYVSLGDSAAAGPMLAPLPRNNPTGCLRSPVNFPTLVAKKLKVRSFRDVTCSGAKSTHFYQPQKGLFGVLGANAPQMTALRPDTTLVTLGPIGANDVYSPVITQCVLQALVNDACGKRFGRQTLRKIALMKPSIKEAIRNVKQRSPRARIYVIGYGVYLPRGGCWPYVPVGPKSADFIQSLNDNMNRVLKKSAQEEGVQYISLQTPEALKHTMCAPLGQNWVQGLPTTDLAAPGHPTALGMRAFANIISSSIRKDLLGSAG